MTTSRWVRAKASVFLFIMGFLRRMTLGVRALVVNGENVLLIRHSYIPGWHLPGGGVDPGETIEEGLVRELFEETGLKPSAPAEFFGHYLNTLGPGRDHVTLYVCRQVEQVREFVPNREIVEMGWFAIDALPDDASRATRLRVAEFFKGAERSRAWGD